MYCAIQSPVTCRVGTLRRFQRFAMAIVSTSAPSRCPRCGSTIRLVAAIEDPAIARRILDCMGLPARAPPTLAPPPSGCPGDLASHDAEHWDFDQTPAYEEP